LFSSSEPIVDQLLILFMPSPASPPSLVMDVRAVDRALRRMARAILAQPCGAGSGADSIVLIGIQTGGVYLARQLATRLAGAGGRAVPVGQLDVTLHRDDLDQRLAPKVHPTSIPFDITGQTVILVDDVLCSGRTIRAALDALNDLGRPRCTRLAVLIDRGHRELPIQADFVGCKLVTDPADRVDVQLLEPPDRLQVVLEKAGPG
jgi:pyrimidine operon attenuation protein/uracil phosphoribosyltransferase